MTQQQIIFLIVAGITTLLVIALITGRRRHTRVTTITTHSTDSENEKAE